MAGIVSYGAYVPYYRLSRGDIFMQWFGQVMPFPGEKAVANFDEDSITMAVAAGIDCLADMDRNSIDGVYFATTSSPFKERHGAGIISQALDVPHEGRAADFTDSTKAGTAALLAALDAVKAGSSKRILVAASDMRLGGVVSGAEMMYGDGAGAQVVGDEDVVATFECSHSINEDIMDTWRSDKDDFARFWEDRWNREQSIGVFIPEAIKAVVAKAGLELKDIAKVAAFGPFPQMHAAIIRDLKIDPAQVQDPLFETVGNSGTALPLMMLTAVLEEAKPGDKIVLAGYGTGGVDALLFTVTDQITKEQKKHLGVKGHVATKAATGYNKMLRWRNMLPGEPGGRAEAQLRDISPQALWRHKKEVLGLYGSRCKKCGRAQIEIGRVCVFCQSIDEYDVERFSDKKAKIFTFTNDQLAYSIDPPLSVAIVDFENGGRNIFDVTDRDPNELKPDLEVTPTFRKMQYTKGIHNYAWKVKPARQGG
jgi:3-hydroxy-3-methylglutaryl CoA synthase